MDVEDNDDDEVRFKKQMQIKYKDFFDDDRTW